MPIEAPSGTLDIENAKLRVSEFSATTSIGIGTENTEKYPLYIYKDVKPELIIQESSTSAAKFTSNNGSLTIQSGITLSDNSDGDIVFSDMGGITKHMTIKGTTGYIGIGTTSPSAKLHVNGGSIKISSGSSGGLYDNGYQWLECKNASDWYRLAQTPKSSGIACYNGIAINSGGGLVVGSWDSPNTLGVGNAYFAGNVGIGILSPAYKLDVNGTLRASNAYFSNMYIGGSTSRGLRSVSGSYGTVQTTGGGAGNYEGYSIDGRYVFMSADNSGCGIYNDLDNEWMIFCARNSHTKLYFDGGEKLATTSTGVSVTGDLTVSGTTTTVDTTNLTVKDTIVELGKDNTVATTDLGIIMRRPGSNVGIIYDGSASKLEIGHTLNGGSDSTITMDTGNALSVNVNGIITATLDGNVTLAADGTNSSRPIIFSTGATGSQSLKTDTGITYNPSTNKLTVTGGLSQSISPGNYLTGTAYNGSAARTFAVNATSDIVPNTVVARNASNNFSANVITATLNGKLATARAINGVDFDGSAAITVNGTSYNVNNVWLREQGDNAHFRQYGNTRQMVFRTDGTTEYASGVGGYPFVWMYGGDAASNRRMFLNNSGQLWCSNYGWLHDKFVSRNSATTQTFTDNNSNATFTGHTIDHNSSGTQTNTANRTHRALFIDYDSTSTGSTTANGKRNFHYAIHSDMRHTGASNAYYLWNHNLYTIGDHTAGTCQDIRGIHNDVRASGVGLNPTLFGIYNFAYKDPGSTGTTNSMFGVYSQLRADAGTVTTSYGFYNLLDMNIVTAPTTYGIYNEINFHAETKATTSHGLLNKIVKSSNATATNLYGSYTHIDLNTNATTNAYGGYNICTIDGSNTSATNSFGVYSEIQIGSGSTQNAYVNRAVIDRNGGTIANGYLYHGSYEGAASNSWGVYITGESKNYFSGTLECDGRIYADNGCHVRGDWLRVNGSNGIYFESYGGGWHMTDSTWIRAYNSKPIWVTDHIHVHQADTGVATLSAYGDSQGTGRLYVGQSTTYGGGIEYNGDNSPTSTGAGADYLTLYRVDNGGYHWTARNKNDTNNWDFRGRVYAEGAFYTNANRSVIRGGSPTLYFRDTDAMSAMLHNNSNLLYVLRGGTDTESWSQVNGQWPWIFNLSNNDSTCGGNLYVNGGTVTATTFSGNATSATNADTVDNLHASSFLRSDADDTVNAGVTYSWAATNTHGLQFRNSSYSSYYLYIGGWSSANNNNISRIRNSSGNLHIDSAANGNLYLNWYTAGSVEVGSSMNVNSGLTATTGNFSGTVTAPTFSGTATYANSAGSAGSVTGKSSISKTAHGFGANDYHLELYSPYTGNPGTEVSLRFHQGSMYWAQIGYNSGGFAFRDGASASFSPVRVGLLGIGDSATHYPLVVWSTATSASDNTYYSGNPYNLSVNVNPDNGGGYNYVGYGSIYGFNDRNEIVNDSNDSVFSGREARGLSIFARGGIYTRGAFVSASDTRIKTNVEDINDGEALDKIRQLKPKTYTYRDKLQYGFKRVYGFLAQEIAQTLPHAVNINPEVIPNILETCNVSSGNIITMVESTTSLIELNQQKDGLDFCKIHLYNEKDEVLEANVIQIVDEYNFEVDRDLSEYSNIFVYGQEVPDFHKLDKNAIFTVATAALQEVDRQQQSDKLRIAELETQLASVLTRLDALENTQS